jgi:AcrR family transcriptional regulator
VSNSPSPGRVGARASRKAPQSKLKQDRAVRTRAAVLTAAAELFAERGYPHTSIADVAERVGMTPGAVYFHFRDKKDMAIEVVRELFRRWLALTERVREEGHPPLQTARVLMDKLVGTFLEDVFVIAGTRLQAERSLIGTTLPPPYVESIASLAAVLAQARGAGQLRKGVDPEAAARMIVATAFGTQHISGVLHQHADLLERWAETRDLLFYSIAADPTAAS